MADGVKPLVDLSLIRGDILEFWLRLQKARQPLTQAFLEQNPSDTIDLMDLILRVQKGNRQFLLDRKEPTIVISQEELLYATRLERYGFDLVGEVVPELQVSKDASFESTMIDSIPAEWQRTPGVSEESIILYMHGGGFYTGSPKSHRRLSIDIGRAASMKVLSIDYRLAPEHCYPAALDDAYAAYDWLINEGYDSSNIVIAGDSAGGYLTLMTLLRLREDRREMPAAGVCISPATDLTFTNDSIFANVKTDPSIANMGIYWVLKFFLDGANPAIAAVSPLFADLEGLPPLLFQASTSEMLYSDSERFVKKARDAGVDVTFQSWNDTLHAFQWFNLPEAKDAIEKIRVFLRDKMV